MLVVHSQAALAVRVLVAVPGALRALLPGLAALATEVHRLGQWNRYSGEGGLVGWKPGFSSNPYKAVLNKFNMILNMFKAYE